MRLLLHHVGHFRENKKDLTWSKKSVKTVLALVFWDAKRILFFIWLITFKIIKQQKRIINTFVLVVNSKTVLRLSPRSLNCHKLVKPNKKLLTTDRFEQWRPVFYQMAVPHFVLFGVNFLIRNEFFFFHFFIRKEHYS